MYRLRNSCRLVVAAECERARSRGGEEVQQTTDDNICPIIQKINEARRCLVKLHETVRSLGRSVATTLTDVVAGGEFSLRGSSNGDPNPRSHCHAAMTLASVVALDDVSDGDFRKLPVSV